ncbi:MAG TPA: hypothetical protein PK867_27970 [Pirellulales bacterium]|nr:hypothetical protein [Pirellulales bacterium]
MLDHARATSTMLSTSQKLLGYFRRYVITRSAIWLRQQGGWVELCRDDIAAVRFETIGRVIVRFYGGQRVVVSLFGLSNSGYDAVRCALRDALHQNEQARGLWDGCADE